MADALVFQVAGTPAVFAAKSGAFLKGHREARAARAQKLRTLSKPLLGVGILLSAGALIGGIAFEQLEAIFALIPGVPAVIGGAFALVTAQKLEADPEVGKDVQGLVKALQAEFHPRSTLHGKIDLRTPAKAVSAERTANSPHSGAPKRYYRHRWFRLAGALVDGSAFALEATSLEKTKNYATMRTTLQVRGRVQLRHGGFEGERRFGLLSALGFERRGLREVVFWGEVGDMDDFLPALRQLGRAIAASDPAEQP